MYNDETDSDEPCEGCGRWYCVCEDEDTLDYGDDDCFCGDDYEEANDEDA